MERIEAIEWLNAIKEKYIRGGDDYYDRQRRFAIDWAIHLFKEDNVEVVRCKDCWKREEFEEGEEGRKWALCYEVSGYVYEDDFCSYGEREETLAPNITEQTMDAINRMGEKVHGG